MLPGNSRWVLVESLANPTAAKGERKSRRAADLPPGWTAEEAAAHAEEQEFKHRQPIVCDLLAGPMLAYSTLSELGKRAAGEFYAGRLFSPAGYFRRLVCVLRWFG